MGVGETVLVGAPGISISPKTRFLSLSRQFRTVRAVSVGARFCVVVSVEVVMVWREGRGERMKQEKKKRKNMVSLGLYCDALVVCALIAHCMPASPTVEPLLIQYTTDPSSELDSVVSSLIRSSIESLSESPSPEEELLSSLAR